MAIGPLDYYLLHDGSDSGVIVHSVEEAEALSWECMWVDFAAYKRARAAGWELDWTENEEL